ncbi:glycosyltransferase [Vibrio ostreae]|uniref:Glycosyltransferase n=1 Tax=Vibrio ostreae TaxID=2841925 RepID=A0A975YN33_9VIBR|nr:glycosyltransferase [Vibrio ostreae]QXO17239.1 glycosyltransferase [Vibrio ostreae]
MLLIYGALGIGGIETFFVRIAKHRSKLGLTTKLLLQYPEKSNKELLDEFTQYGEIVSYDDLFVFPRVAKYFKLTSPIKSELANILLNNVDQIHVFQGEDALLGYRLTNITNSIKPISVGFYHYVHYLWGGTKIPYFEKINRKFVLEFLPKRLLMMFSEDNIKLYEKHTGEDFSSASTFSIGVIDKKNVIEKIETNKNDVNICAVGRLVAFKTYNLQLINVIKKLLEQGYNVSLDIYGDGPCYGKIKNLIQEYKVEKYVTLKGSFDYSQFDNIVSLYDLFIGTGTAIVQASALGVPSIATIDNSNEADCYGYFYNVSDRQYGRIGLDANKEKLFDVIKMYFSLDFESINIIRQKHIDCVERYLIENSVSSMNELSSVNMPSYKFSSFSKSLYEFSRIYSKIVWKLSPNKLKEKQTLPVLESGNDERF